MQTAVAQVAQGNVAQALQALSQLVTLDPEHGHELIMAEPALTPIGADVANLLERLSFQAKSEAEQVPASASLAMGNPNQAGARAHNPDAQAVLALAGRLIESGQHMNFVRAGELAQIVLAYYGAPAMDAPPIDFSEMRSSHGGRTLPTGRAIQRLKTAWCRAQCLLGYLSPSERNALEGYCRGQLTETETYVAAMTDGVQTVDFAPPAAPACLALFT